MAETKTLIAMSAIGNVEGVKEALQRGGDPNKISEIGRTALHAAASKGHQEVVAVLLEHPGVDPNVVTLDTDWSSLHLAVSVAIFGACPDMVEILLKQPGININARDRWGETALHLAARFDREEILRLLLDQPGIDEKATTNRGASVLHAAVHYSGGPNVLGRFLTSPTLILM